jgi:hypothetical protein
MSETEILARLDRVESTLAIQQLPIRYAIAIDSRDIDALVELWADDVNCGSHGKGREALRGFIDPLIRDFYRTVHKITGHAIDFVDADHATGKVYCHAEHEYGDRWIVQAICYFDTYERRDGKWFFVRRDEDFFYTADHLERPQDADFLRWPGPAPKHNPPMMLERLPSWVDFWSRSEVEKINQVTKHPVAEVREKYRRR